MGSTGRRTHGLLALAVAGLCVCAAVSCDDTDGLVCVPLPNECPDLIPSYTDEIAPIIAAHCGQCHTAEDPNGPWPFDDVTDVADWRLEIQLSLEECLMPPLDTAAPLSAADRQTLHAWLVCGAPPN
jgi:hypothetical protein